MNKYMHHGFGSHPTVASQYLSFLVDSRGKDAEQKESKVLKNVDRLESRIEAVDKIAKEARSAASTTANGLDQLKTKVGTLNRNNRNNGGGNVDN